VTERERERERVCVRERVYAGAASMQELKAVIGALLRWHSCFYNCNRGACCNNTEVRMLRLYSGTRCDKREAQADLLQMVIMSKAIHNFLLQGSFPNETRDPTIETREPIG